MARNIGETTAKVIMDSINDEGFRLITLEVEYPTFIQAQLNTHKILSKNSASQRAIPTKTFLHKVPVFVPARVALYQRGMGESEFLQGEDYDLFVTQWLEWEQLNVNKHEEIQRFWKERLGKKISKGLMNRPISCFRYTKTVLTGAMDQKGWSNFFRLRCADDAQGEHQILANAIRDAVSESSPVNRVWHLPYAPEDKPLFRRITWSCSQCARLSYRKENKGQEAADKRLFNGLKSNGHWSTYEHQAVARSGVPDLDELVKGYDSVHIEGNFFGTRWALLRKFFDHHTATDNEVFKRMSAWIDKVLKGESQ